MITTRPCYNYYTVEKKVRVRTKFGFKVKQMQRKLP